MKFISSTWLIFRLKFKSEEAVKILEFGIVESQFNATNQVLLLPG
jgi:hypothetical protein